MSLHIGINLCPYTGGYGGAEVYLKNLVAALARTKCRHQVSLFIAGGMEGHFSAATGFREIICGRVGQSRPRRVWLEQTALPRLVRQHNLDLIFSNYVSPVGARCRQIVNVHDLLYLVYPAHIPERAKRWYWSVLVPASIRRAERVLTVSRSSADDLRRFFPAHAHKVVIVGQAVGYELANMNSPDRDGEVIAHLGVTEPYLLCTAGLDRQKNISGLLRGFEAVAQRHRDVSIVLTDPYRRVHTDALDGLKTHVRNRVILAGCVSPRQLAAFYRRAAGHITPSRFEGFGRTVIEAQHFGCPTIASLAASLPETAGDAALFFHPDDTSTLAAHLETVLRDEPRRQEMIRRGYRNVQRFQWDAAVRQFLDVCDPTPEPPGQRQRVDRRPRLSPLREPARATRRRGQKHGRVKELPLLILMPHSRCNCRCIMCDIWKDNGNRRELSLEQVSSWQTAFKKLRVRRVMLTGGEPLLHGDVDGLLRLLHECGLNITLLSAGSLLCRHAHTIVHCCGDVVVSLDGSSAVHDAIRRVPGAFAALADGVNALRRLDASFRITGRCTIQRGNFRDWLNIVQSARAIGLDSISFQAADVTTTAFNHPQGWTPDQNEAVAVPRSELPELRDAVETIIRSCAAEIRSGFIHESPAKLRRIANHFAALCGERAPVAPRCSAPWVSTVIEADGTVRPCFFHRSVGNIHDSSLTDIVNSEAMVRFRQELSVEDDPICRRCVCALDVPPGRGSASFWKPRPVGRRTVHRAGNGHAE